MHTYLTALPHHKILKKDGIYSCTHNTVSLPIIPHTQKPNTKHKRTVYFLDNVIWNHFMFQLSCISVRN